MTYYTAEGFEFEGFPKIPRHEKSSDLIITEKIDGTNAAIHIRQYIAEGSLEPVFTTEIVAQSRTRFITPDSDNFGFAGWVFRNREALVSLLGPGLHYGEWYGQGIQRNYGMKEKRFALFDQRWAPYPEDGALAPVRAGGFGYQVPEEVAATLVDMGLEVVPTLYRGPWSDVAIADATTKLMMEGSQSYGGRGFKPAEGVVLLNRHSQTRTKVVFDTEHKSQKPGYLGRDRDDNPVFEKRVLLPHEIEAMRNSPEAQQKRFLREQARQQQQTFAEITDAALAGTLR